MFLEDNEEAQEGGGREGASKLCELGSTLFDDTRQNNNPNGLNVLAQRHLSTSKLPEIFENFELV